ncbi:MAG: signal recognition particle-docking protein FtsY [Bacteroidales bacterium]|nr:signal recognition particle-docking protein FtsY [Bacteroidales bacterium]
MKISNFITSLKNGLKKTKDNLIDRYDLLFSDVITDKSTFLEKIEELLILSDIGPHTTAEILERFQNMSLHLFRINDFDHFKELLKQMLRELIPPQMNTFKIDPKMLNIVLVMGVNGAGKTSFAGKLAYYYKSKGYDSLLIPADTFRAGAIEQLYCLSKEAGVEFLRTTTGSDPASVVFDGIQSAKAKKKVLLIIDTAGRLHTYHNLMQELAKIKRVILKNAPNASLHSTLVIDATTGQNGLFQAINFKESLGVSDITMTKLDGTAKGGIVLTIQKELSIPVSFITLGEKITDICKYDQGKFIDTLLD